MAFEIARVYEAARAMCGDILLASQVEGLSRLIDVWTAAHVHDDPRWFAYILATVQHETARSFLPIEEVGCGAGKAYGTRFYGRGYCQLTWETNYARFGKLLGVDLVRAPEKALDPAVAGPILFRGMIEGLYTGRKLGQYIVGSRCDFVGARRVVNGEDKATLIASYAKRYSAAIGCGAEGAVCSKAA